MKKNNLELFINKILDTPLWIRQAVLVYLENNLEGSKRENSFALYVPSLTFKGENELIEKRCGFDGNIYNFLQFCKDNLSMLEISMNTFLSLEETAKILEFCIEQNFINQPDKDIFAFAGFISGKYRLGEYLNEIGMISSEQLENAIQKIGGKKFGETLVELGFIKSADIKQLLILKEEAQKRFVIDYNSIPQISSTYCDEKSKYEEEIADLKEENMKLKKKMGQLLQLVKNHD